MVIVFQVHRRTTSLAPFQKVVWQKLHIQVSLPFLNLNRKNPLYKEKGNLITSAEREVKDSRRSRMYQSCHFLTRLGTQSLEQN